MAEFPILTDAEAAKLYPGVLDWADKRDPKKWFELIETAHGGDKILIKLKKHNVKKIEVNQVKKELDGTLYIVGELMGRPNEWKVKYGDGLLFKRKRGEKWRQVEMVTKMARFGFHFSPKRRRKSRKFRAGGKQEEDEFKEHEERRGIWTERQRERHRDMLAARERARKRAQDERNVACLRRQSLDDWFKRAKIESECARYATRRDRMPRVRQNIEHMKHMRWFCNVNRACRRLGKQIPKYKQRNAASEGIAVLAAEREEIPPGVLKLMKEYLVGPDQEALELGCPLPEDNLRIIADYVGQPNLEWSWKFSSKRRKKKSRRRRKKKSRRRRKKKSRRRKSRRRKSRRRKSRRRKSRRRKSRKR